MTNEEINRLVAEKVMGYQTKAYGFGKDAQVLCWKTQDKNEDGFLLPNYAEDMNAALGALRKLQENREGFDSIYLVYHRDEVGAGFVGTEYTPFAETEARALCLAMLEAVK
jgi:hypothetical protein